MERVGIRELKARTGEVLRRVRERSESFEITHRGRVIARLVPATQGEWSPEERSAFWRDWDRLSREIGARWPKGVSAEQAIREDRDRI